ncbi:MAG: VWA domain-containing protein [Rubrivivax sp.]
MKPGLAVARLPLLARALGLPALQLQLRAGAGRWRGAPGQVGQLALDPRATPRAARLQLLRHVLDTRDDGRFALRFDAVADAALIGPLAPAGPGPLDLVALLQSWPHARLLTRRFLLVDGRRVDQVLGQVFPGARADRALDAPPRADGDAGVAVDARQALEQALAWYRPLQAGRALRRTRWLALDALRSIDAPRAPGRPWPGWRGDGPGQASPPSSDAGTPVPEAQTAPGGRPGAAPPGLARAGVPEAPGAASPAARVRRAPASRAAATTLHPEWDFRQGGYRAQWVTVHERALEPDPATALPTLDERRLQARRRLRRRLEAAAADAPRRLRAQDEGHAVDLDAAIEAWVGRRAGQGPSRSGLYLAAPPRARDLAVALLIDASASTDHVLNKPPREPVPAAAAEPDEPLWQLLPLAPEPAVKPRRVIDVFKDAAALLVEVLEAQGDRSALFAFSGEGRAFVDFVALKRFDEPWSARAQGVVAALRPLGSTRTGAAVRHATLQLRRADARRRVLIVLSDGYPQDSDYGRDADDLAHGLADTARALREAESAGIGVLNVSVDAAAHDYLRRICPRHRYLVMRDVETLPDRLVHWWRHIARAAR